MVPVEAAAKVSRSADVVITEGQASSDEEQRAAQQEHQATAAERLSLVQPSQVSEAVGAPLAWLAIAGGLLGALRGREGF